MKIIIIILSSLLCSCAIATKYVDAKKDRVEHVGYSDQGQFGDFRVARFVGNRYTSANQALELSRFRAYEQCSLEGSKLTSIALTKNFSQVSRRVEGSSVTFPDKGLGSSSFSSAQMVTDVYPAFDTFYRCQNKIYLSGLEYDFKSADEMKGIVRDLMAGVQIVRKEKGSINSEFEVGDIITKIGGERVQDRVTPASIFYPLSADPVEVNLLRNGEPMSLTLRFKDVTDGSIKRQNDFIREVCHRDGYFLRKTSLCKEASK